MLPITMKGNARSRPRPRETCATSAIAAAPEMPPSSDKPIADRQARALTVRAADNSASAAPTQAIALHGPQLRKSSANPDGSGRCTNGARDLGRWLPITAGSSESCKAISVQPAPNWRAAASKDRAWPFPFPLCAPYSPRAPSEPARTWRRDR
jgi:hypothetical protein